MPDNPILNPLAIQALRDLSPDGGDELLRELITIFLADTPKQLAGLEDAVSRQDPSEVIRAAHTIRGSSANFGASEFARLAHQIEMHGKSIDLAAATAALPDFKAEFDRVAGELAKLASAP